MRMGRILSRRGLHPRGDDAADGEEPCACLTIFRRSPPILGEQACPSLRGWGGRLVSSALTSHSRVANLSSWDAFDEHASAFLAKYLPLKPSTSGEDAR
jgi:hypothetical protein